MAGQDAHAPAAGQDAHAQPSPAGDDDAANGVAGQLARARLARRAVASRRILLAGIVAMVAGSIPALLLSGDAALLFDNLQQIAATVAAVVALVLSTGSGADEQRRVQRRLLAGLCLVVLGLVAWSLMPGGSTTVSVFADVCFALAVTAGLTALVPALFGGLDRWTLTGIAIDAGILFFTGVNVAGAFWWAYVGSSGSNPEMVAVFGATIMFASSGAGMFGLLARRVMPSIDGPWAVLFGFLLSGLAWIAWLQQVAHGDPAAIGPPDFMLSAGVLLIARGALTWKVQPSAGATADRIAALVSMGFPIVAIVVSVALDVVTPRVALQVNVVAIGTGSVVLVAAARQVLLLHLEHRARTSERRTSTRLADEIRERADTIVSLARLEPATTPEETARRICAEALRLDGIDVAVVHSLTQAGAIVPLAVAGFAPDEEELLRQPMPAELRIVLAAQAVAGPWTEIVDPRSSGQAMQVLSQAGLHGIANAGLRWEDRLVGIIGLGTRSESVARTLSERLPTMREFAVVGAALLGPALADREHMAAIRDSIQATIDDHAFRPVFQPVIELATGRAVGFEALTRFDDGTRPDLRFMEAASAGMSIPLEMATLRAALSAARVLPSSAWLSLNVSPLLASSLLPIVSLLEGVTRNIVLEITEHVEIGDYERLVGALSSLGGQIRIAVDDAGAGYAGLRHILELRPHFVKLDIVLVRSIDRDPARRAMVSSLRDFARDTGSVLIAEGVETEGELGVLRALGVDFGQGFLLGRPAPAERPPSRS